MQKGILSPVLFFAFHLMCSTESYSVEQLYRSLNVSCYEETELKRICDSQVVCACPSLIERTGEKCAVLYQFLAPGVTCNLTSRGLRNSHFVKWWSNGESNGDLISPSQLSNFILGIKQGLREYFSVDFVNKRCFIASDILQDQGLPTKKCFSSSSVGQVCSAIVDRLSRGESICDTEVVDDVSCIEDIVEQLFQTLADESGKMTLTQLQLLINQLPNAYRSRSVRQTEDYDHDDHDHGDDTEMNCPTESQLVDEFNHVVEEFGLMDDDGLTCMQHHLNDSHDDDDHDDDDDADHHTNATNCSTIYRVCRNLILETGLTNKACLAGNITSTATEHDDDNYVSDSEAYGYGLLSTVIISAASQIGVISILFSYSRQGSKYVMSVLIAIGVSVLVSDSILHLIPHAFEEEEEGGDGHDHGSEGHNHSNTVIWRGCCVLAGIFIIYISEFVINSIKKRMEQSKRKDSQEQGFELRSSPIKMIQTDTSSQSSCDSCLNLKLDMEDQPSYYNPNQGFFHDIPSVAWMIILGDGIHNFADGVAIGTSFTSSLGLGISVSLAILFHEIPHEFGDFAILLSSGMRWYVALMYNFLSAVTAIIGMFVGVAIGNSHDEATAWILATTAGIFLYVALVDLLPSLLDIFNKCKDGRSIMIYMSCHLIGFFIGFAILLPIAVYEEDINSLVD